MQDKRRKSASSCMKLQVLYICMCYCIYVCMYIIYARTHTCADEFHAYTHTHTISHKYT
jgi:hypothetical protein